MGRQAPGTGRRDRHHPPGAPREYRSLAAAFAADGRDPAGRAGGRRGQPVDVGVRGSSRPEDQTGCCHPCVECAGNGDRSPEDRRARSPVRRAGVDRRRPVDPAHSHRRAGARCGFLRVLGPQDLRPHRHRCALRTRGRVRGNTAVAGRRQHDRRRHVGTFALSRSAEQVRSRYRQYRRRSRPGRGAAVRRTRWD